MAGCRQTGKEAKIYFEMNRTEQISRIASFIIKDVYIVLKALDSEKVGKIVCDLEIILCIM